MKTRLFSGALAALALLFAGAALAQTKIPAVRYVGIDESDLRSRAEAQCTWCGPWGTPELL